MQNLAWLLPVAAAVLILAVLLGLALAWVRSRGQFMFLHCVAFNRAEVSLPWHRYAREANSLFLFQVVLGLISLLCVLPLVAGIVVFILLMVSHGGASVLGIFGLVCVILLTLLVAIFFGVVRKFTRDFVVPIQFARGGSAIEGWRTLFTLVSENAGHFILYILFQIVLTFVILAGVASVVLITCCIAGCLLMIPYLGTVLFLPVLLFKRAYSLHYLAQYGPGFNVFPEQPMPPQ